MEMAKRCFLAWLATLVFSATAYAGFVDNGDGTVTDTSTGLMWEIKTDDGGLRDKDNTYTWQQALNYCENLDLANHRDWRLPDSEELRSIVDYSKYNPSIDETYFPYTKSSGYWSSSTYANRYPGYAWLVFFRHGFDNYSYKYDSLYVRAVRGGPCGSFDDSVITLISPNTAATYSKGETVAIQWSTQNLAADADITLSIKRGMVPPTQLEPDGVNWYRFTESTPNDGEEQVVIPQDVSSGDDWRFYAGITAENEKWDSSDETIIIEGEPLDPLVIAQSPMSGPPGTTFVQWGTGFTPDGTATLHFRKPDNTEYPVVEQPIDVTGGFSIEYTVAEGETAGTYTWWAVDVPTGSKSNELSYVIESSTTIPFVDQNPMTGAPEAFSFNGARALPLRALPASICANPMEPKFSPKSNP